MENTKTKENNLSDYNYFLMRYLSLYWWSIKESYSFMEGNRGIYFWLVLPWKAHLITWRTLVDNNK